MKTINNYEVVKCPYYTDSDLNPCPYWVSDGFGYYCYKDEKPNICIFEKFEKRGAR